MAPKDLFEDFECSVEAVEANPEARVARKENEIRRRMSERFEAARKSLGYSQRELAKRIGTSISQVQRLLQEEHSGSLTLRTIVRAADVLDLHVDCDVVPNGSVDSAEAMAARCVAWAPVPSVAVLALPSIDDMLERDAVRAWMVQGAQFITYCRPGESYPIPGGDAASSRPGRGWANADLDSLEAVPEMLS